MTKYCSANRQNINTHTHSNDASASCVSCHISSHAGGRVLRKSPNTSLELPDAPLVTVSLSYPIPSSCHENCDECVQHTQWHISHDKSLHLMPQNFIKRKRNQALLMYVCPAALFAPQFHPLSISLSSPPAATKNAFKLLR